MREGFRSIWEQNTTARGERPAALCGATRRLNCRCKMQIHIDLTSPCRQQIKIYSKSKRDSPADRRATHVCVCNASLAFLASGPMLRCGVLLLPDLISITAARHQSVHTRSPSKFLALLQDLDRSKTRVSRAIILEVEMICPKLPTFSDFGDQRICFRQMPYIERKWCIEEF